jgi:hypothetical protein
VSAQNSCGWSSSGYHYITVTDPSSYYSTYPNPASDVLNIEIDVQAATQARVRQINSSGSKPLKTDPDYDIRLYDGQGNLLRQQDTKGGTVQFDVTNLSNGIYYLHVYDGVNRKPEIRQIVVEH